MKNTVNNAMTLTTNQLLDLLTSSNSGAIPPAEFVDAVDGIIFRNDKIQIRYVCTIIDENGFPDTTTCKEAEATAIGIYRWEDDEWEWEFVADLTLDGKIIR